MRFYIACVILYITTLCPAFGQAYKYISVTEGLSDRRVLSIQKDNTGFMWFLTYTGIDRYDGKNIKHYRLQSNEGYISFYSEKNILKIDKHGRTWAIGPEGELFKYIPVLDRFVEVKLPAEVKNNPLELVEMTDFGEVWYCFSDFCYVYNQDTETLRRITFDHQHKHITCLYQYDKNSYIIGSNDGVCRTIIDGEKPVVAECIISAAKGGIPQFLYVHAPSKRLFIGNEQTGLTVYDLTLGRVEHTYSHLKDFLISNIVQYNEKQLLISTRGAGVYLYDFQRSVLEHFAYAEYEIPLRMNGNNIHALYVDEDKRVWMSAYGRGITYFDENLPSYTLYRHYIGNKNSLSDDLVNAVLEDSDGDFWFATNNGLSIYFPKTEIWQHLFQWDKSKPETLKDCIFLSLSEISPGRIVAGGFMTGVYVIDKKTMETRNITPLSYKRSKNPNFSNKYIRVIYPDKEGVIWTGGSQYLGRTDKINKTFQDFFIGKAITCILEKDPTTLLIGTGDGIYRFDKRTFKKEKLRMPFASQQINTMYLHTNGDLYIGTTNSGLVILHKNGEYNIYRYQTTALLSNTINTIVPVDDNQIIIATEQNIALFNIQKGTFRNWTNDQGLITANFSPRAGIHTSRGTLLFGSNGGAVEWSDTMRISKRDTTKVIIDLIMIENQQSVSPVDSIEGIAQLDSITELCLTHKQNSISIHLAAIDYGNPQYTYLHWKLKGRYDYWSLMNEDNRLQFRDLKPGEYTLQIQNISREDYRILGEKVLRIKVLPSFWQSNWGNLFFLLCAGLLVFIVKHYIKVRRKQKGTELTNRTLVSAVSNVRAPLALIKSISNEVMQHEALTDKGNNYMQLVVYCAEKLNLMANNLLNVELESNIQRLKVEQYDLNELIRHYVSFFDPLIKQEQITVQFEDCGEKLPVWIDLKKIDLVVCNLLANLLKNTAKDGTIYLSVSMQEKNWCMSLHNRENTSREMKENTTVNEHVAHMNQKQLNEELYVLQRLVHAHRGTLECRVYPSSKYTFKVTVPLKHISYFKQKPQRSKTHKIAPTFTHTNIQSQLMPHPIKGTVSTQKKGHILLMEEDAEVLTFLDNALCDEWNISMSRSVKVALGHVHEFQPDIIIASIVSTQNIGNDFCSILKSDMNTSHIPIILMTTDDDKEHVMNGFMYRADYFITKPFDLPVLRAILTNILENRRMLQERLTQVDVVHNLKEIKNVNVEQESKFLSDVRKMIKDHIDDPNFSVDELCSLMGMSRTSLYSKIKTLTHSSPSDIVREIRMQRACDLLLSEKCNIMEVSDRMGFSEPKYFREVFKKHFGISPSEYIKKHCEMENLRNG